MIKKNLGDTQVIFGILIHLSTLQSFKSKSAVFLSKLFERENGMPIFSFS